MLHLHSRTRIGCISMFFNQECWQFLHSELKKKKKRTLSHHFRNAKLGQQAKEHIPVICALTICHHGCGVLLSPKSIAFLCFKQKCFSYLFCCISTCTFRQNESFNIYLQQSLGVVPMSWMVSSVMQKLGVVL